MNPNLKGSRIMFFQEKFISKKQEKGNTSVLLIFIHGFGGCGDQWFNQINYFENYFDLLILDLPGHGNNNSNESIDDDFSPEIITHQLFLLLSKHKHQIKIAICHSYGSSLACFFVERHPKVLKKLIFIAPSIYPLMNQLMCRFISKLPDFIVEFFRYLLWIGGENSVILRLYLNHCKEVDIRRRMVLWNDSFKSRDLKRTLKCIKWPEFHLKDTEFSIPLLVIHGELDSICVLDKTLKLVNDNFLNYEFVCIKNCGHQAMLEFPSFVNAVILDRVQKYFKLDSSSVFNQKFNFCLKGPLKNRDKWTSTDNHGERIFNLIPMKVNIFNSF